MREQLQQHEHLRLREQLKMQQELLHKQQVWMHQQLQKKSFLRLPRKEATTLDDWQFTRIINKQTETTEVKSRFKTVQSVELSKEDTHTTERRETKSKKKHTKIHKSSDNHKKYRHELAYGHHKPKQTRENWLEIATDMSKQYNTKESTQEINHNTLSSSREIVISTPAPHQNKYNVQVHIYSVQFLEIGLQVFDEMLNKTHDETIKAKLQVLPDIYTTKYKEFLNETYKHDIKTRLGIQKVVLDAIDASDRILKRLVNGIVIDLDNRGSLRENIDAINDFQQEVRKSKDRQYQLLCSKLNICRSGNGFPEFLSEFLTTIVRCNDKKFQSAIDALTEVAKEVDFRNVFHKKTRKQIKKTIEHVEKQSLGVLRPSLLIIRNIIAHKNRPIIIKPSDLKRSRVNSTIAFLEILDAFDVKLPRTDAYIFEWWDLRTSLHEWEKDRRNDIQDIMGIFMRNIKEALDGMPSSMQDHVAENLGLFIK